MLHELAYMESQHILICSCHALLKTCFPFFYRLLISSINLCLNLHVVLLITMQFLKALVPHIQDTRISVPLQKPLSQYSTNIPPEQGTAGLPTGSFAMSGGEKKKLNITRSLGSWIFSNLVLLLIFFHVLYRI